MPSHQTVRWLPALLIIATATALLYAQAWYWDNRPLELLAPFLILALPVFVVLLSLYLRPLWQRPMGLLIQALMTGKCRWLFICTIVLNITFLAFWVRTWTRDDALYWFQNCGSRAFALSGESTLGSAKLEVLFVPNANGTFPEIHKYHSSIDGLVRPRLGTFHFWVRSHGVSIKIPYLVLAVLSALPLLVIATLKAYHTARDQTPRCRKCDYNLTGNLSGICPECGSAVFTPSHIHEEDKMV